MTLIGDRPVASPVEARAHERAAALRATLGRLIGELDAAALTPREAERLVEEFAAMERLVQTGKLLAAGRVAEGEGWSRAGHRTPAEWLARTTKSSLNEAGRLVETAKRLVDQPQLEAAMRRGDLNCDQATEISQAAAADPTAETRLLQTADRESLGALRDDAARTKAAARGDDAARHEHARRHRHLRTCVVNGEHRVEGSNTTSAGAIIEAALKAYQEFAFRAGKASGRRDSFEAYRADALEMLSADAIGVTPTCLLTTFGWPDAATPIAERCEEPAVPSPPAGLFDDDRGDHKTDGKTADERVKSGAGSPPRTRPTPRRRTRGIAPPGAEPLGPVPPAEAGPALPGTGPATVIPWNRGRKWGAKLPGGRVKIIGRIDVPVLHRGHTEPGDTCDIVGLGPVPVTAIRDLVAAADPFLAAVVTHGHDVMTVAHLGRQPTAYQRTALQFRDAHCVVEGCNRTFCDVDHNTGWAITHDTHTGDITFVCPPDHDKKNRGWHLERPREGTRRRRLLPPDHPDHPNQRAP